MQLENALQSAENLLRQPAQQIRKLEEIPKILVSLDDQLESEHRLIMAASSNIVNLALEHRTMEQMLTYYFNSLDATSV